MVSAIVYRWIDGAGQPVLAGERVSLFHRGDAETRSGKKVKIRERGGRGNLRFLLGSFRFQAIQTEERVGRPRGLEKCSPCLRLFPLFRREVSNFAGVATKRGHLCPLCVLSVFSSSPRLSVSAVKKLFPKHAQIRLFLRAMANVDALCQEPVHGGDAVLASRLFQRASIKLCRRRNETRLPLPPPRSLSIFFFSASQRLRGEKIIPEACSNPSVPARNGERRCPLPRNGSLWRRWPGFPALSKG